MDSRGDYSAATGEKRLQNAEQGDFALVRYKSDLEGMSCGQGGRPGVFEISLPPRTLLFATEYISVVRHSLGVIEVLTAVSSAFLSFSSTFPPGKAV